MNIGGDEQNLGLLLFVWYIMSAKAFISPFLKTKQNNFRITKVEHYFFSIKISFPHRVEVCENPTSMLARMNSPWNFAHHMEN